MIRRLQSQEWCATRQVDMKKYKIICCSVHAGQLFYAANYPLIIYYDTGIVNDRMTVLIMFFLDDSIYVSVS